MLEFYTEFFVTLNKTLTLDLISSFAARGTHSISASTIFLYVYEIRWMPAYLQKSPTTEFMEYRSILLCLPQITRDLCYNFKGRV